MKAMKLTRFWKVAIPMSAILLAVALAGCDAKDNVDAVDESYNGYTGK